MNLADVWKLANTTMDVDLIEICIPLIAKNVNTLMTDYDFLCHTQLDGLKALLLNLPEEKQTKLKMISAWAKAHLSNDVLYAEEMSFDELLKTLDMQGIDLTSLNLDVELQEKSKEDLH